MDVGACSTDEELAANLAVYTELASRVVKNLAGKEKKAADAQGGSKPRHEPPKPPAMCQAALELALELAKRKLALMPFTIHP